MPTHRLLCIVAATALALLASPTALAGSIGPEPCAPAGQPPAPPAPLQAHRGPDGVHLAWKDPLRPLLGTPVDHYLVFRSPAGGDLRMELIAQVDGNAYEYVDMAAMFGGDFVYWVAGHNCQGVGQTSNPASTYTTTCADWGLNPTAVPPLQWAWVDLGCSVGVRCVVIVSLSPVPTIDHAGCDRRVP